MKRVVRVAIGAAGVLFAVFGFTSLAVAQQGGAGPSNNPPLFKGPRKQADAKERTLTGTVTDSMDNPVEGAVVQIKDTKTLRVRSFLTKADGKYQFHGLSLDTDYEVKAERNGQSSNTRTLTVYDTRKDPILNLKIE